MAKVTIKRNAATATTVKSGDQGLQNIDKIIDKVKSIMDNIDISELSEDENIESEFRLDDEEYMIYINYSIRKVNKKNICTSIIVSVSR